MEPSNDPRRKELPPLDPVASLLQQLESGNEKDNRQALLAIWRANSVSPMVVEPLVNLIRRACETPADEKLEVHGYNDELIYDENYTAAVLTLALVAEDRIPPLLKAAEAWTELGLMTVLDACDTAIKEANLTRKVLLEIQHRALALSHHPDKDVRQSAIYLEETARSMNEELPNLGDEPTCFDSCFLPGAGPDDSWF